jgi:anti-sigma factor ChrR (cupin superfamily)
VKLRQFDPDDATRVVIDTTAAAWSPGLMSGLEVLPLHSFGTEEVALVRWAAGTVFDRHSHPQGEEIFVIEGVFEDEHGQYPAGSWLRNPPGSSHTPFSAEGCLIYVKTGHLPS